MHRKAAPVVRGDDDLRSGDVARKRQQVHRFDAFFQLDRSDAGEMHLVVQTHLRHGQKICAKTFLRQFAKLRGPRALPENQDAPAQDAGAGDARKDRTRDHHAKQPKRRRKRNPAPAIGHVHQPVGAELHGRDSREQKDQRENQPAAKERLARVDQRVHIVKTAGMHHRHDAERKEQREKQPPAGDFHDRIGAQDRDAEIERRGDKKRFRDAQGYRRGRHKMAENPKHISETPADRASDCSTFAN